MNKAKLKTYAPAARRDFIRAVTDRAHLLGLAEGHSEPIQVSGEVALIGGRAYPKKIAAQRQGLEARIRREGFGQVMEAVAYTWFNRFAALRYMELHGYLDHGYRVLSHPAGTALPELLEQATSVELPGLPQAQVIELKLAGNQDAELYRRLLVAQCNALAVAMPFLFERIDDETELLLPDNLLHSDSLIRKLVNEIDADDWQQVEIIGWLYQFYISEKKDQVIGKVVKSEDIPAATQLFTPNWIVQYLVQNSIGRLWLMANPASTLKTRMPYYIEPAEQTEAVGAALAAITQARMDEDGGTLNPESITVLDPACGSGHILVEAYEVLKAIYLERGYQPRAIPRLILEHNLYGLDIDDRAAQLAGFALLMKARADDRRLLENAPQLNVLSLRESKDLDAVAMAQALLPSPAGGRGAGGEGLSTGFADSDLFPGTRPQMSLGESVTAESSGSPFGDDDAALTRPTLALLPSPAGGRGAGGEGAGIGEVIHQLLTLFTHAKTFGSLIQIPASLTPLLPTLGDALKLAKESDDLHARAAAEDLLPLVRQAQILAMQFDAVVANPPYMGGKGMNTALKDYAKATFPDSKSDLFAMFIERGFGWCKPNGFNSMVTMQSWMFLSSYEGMRDKILSCRTVNCLVQIGYNSFPEINSKIAQACAFVFFAERILEYSGSYVNLNSQPQSSDKGEVFLNQREPLQFTICQDAFCKIPGSPLAYWLSVKLIESYNKFTQIFWFAQPLKGMFTGDNDTFVRFHWEISGIEFNCPSHEYSVTSKYKWYPYVKGGEYRKWYGNMVAVVDFLHDGVNLNEFAGYGARNPEYYFRECVTWTDITSMGSLAARQVPSGAITSSVGCGLFSEELSSKYLLAALCSCVSNFWLSVLNPTIHANPGDIGNLPLCNDADIIRQAEEIAVKAVSIAKQDWDSAETSWDFLIPWFLMKRQNYISEMWQSWSSETQTQAAHMKKLEEENNRLFINAYGLQDELSPEVPEDQITLARADREKDCQRLISYAIGCMMGRYSLDRPGLIYAHAGNVDFDKIYYGRDTPPFEKGGAGGISTTPAHDESQKQIPPDPPLIKGGMFAPDADGIVPITDEAWFPDDAAKRIHEFLLAVWGAETLEENLAWLAESLGKKGSETPEETIRRYLADTFFKNHLQTYKKRPIYWHFSSGKQGAFQALVYLHRYHEGTLARMRGEYVIPLQGKLAARIGHLQDEIAAAPSTAARNKLQKQLDALKKKQTELIAYDDLLRHYADQRIPLDLDDGVKVNYGKFGNLLAEVKAVTGGSGDE